MQRVVVVTEDGSSSVYMPELNESYHSKFGSAQESQHVFIEAGLVVMAEKKTSLVILEIGFGTGLNAFLTYLWSLQHQVKIEYHAIEPYPLEKEIYSALNYPAILHAEKQQDIFIQLHESGWHAEIILNVDFTLYKYESTLKDFDPQFNADVIYFDAFAPGVQPELWTEEVFVKMYGILKPDGILTTYCAKGEVKRNMKAAGFLVEALPGPKGKREMTRAVKSANSLISSHGV